MSQTLIRFAADTSCTADGYCTNLPQSAASTTNVQNILHIIIGIFAVVTILMVVIAALNMTTAQGDPAKVAKARSGIIYSLVGLVIVVSADLIVALIVGKL